MSRNLRFAAVLLALAPTVWAPPLQAAQLTIGPPSGGNCTSLGGFWVTSSSSCVLITLTLGRNDTLFIIGNSTVQIVQSMVNHGTVHNDAKIVGFGTMRNHGEIFSDEMFVNGFLVNEEGALFRNEVGGECTGTPTSTLVNYGDFINRGEMTLEIDEELEQQSGFFNVGSVVNTGAILGGATLTHPGSTLFNQGTFDNTIGLIRNAMVDNHGLINGGLIDDSGGAQAFVVNNAGATIDGAEITKVSLDNFGTLDNHTFGSGTIVNDEGGLIRAVGGETYLVLNDGVIDILDDFEMFNSFTNSASAILVNRGNMLSHTHLVNHGLFDNRGSWVNNGDDTGPGVIDNFGTLLNASTISNCDRFLNDEQVNNFGTLSNGGTVTSCGTTNQGVWYECGGGGIPDGNPVLPGLDGDSDGVCAPVDCEDSDADAWATATEVLELTVARVEHAIEFGWSVPHYFGGASMLYDLVSSAVAADFLGAGSCVASDLSGNLLRDPTPNVPGSTLYFLVRASGCGGGLAGFDSSGVPRDLPSCP